LLDIEPLTNTKPRVTVKVSVPSLFFACFAIFCTILAFDRNDVQEP
jgi:hypothetical protein